MTRRMLSIAAVVVALAARAGVAQPLGAAPYGERVREVSEAGWPRSDGGSLALYSFEGSTEGWRGLDSEGAGGSSCAPAQLGDAPCLKIGGQLPGVAGALARLPSGKSNWHPFTHLVLSVYVPDTAPPRVQAIVYVKDTDLSYYQHLRKSYLARGTWTQLRLDLTGDSSAWEFRGHYKPWDGYCRQDVQELGVKFIGEEPYEGPFYLGRISLDSDGRALPAENVIYDLRASDAVVGRSEKFELSFDLARTYSNPFDPEVVDVRGCFICPDQRVVAVPGFFYQGYLRRMDRGAEVLAPMGRSQWKVRFAPLELGTYHYYVEVSDGELIRSEIGQFECVPSSRRGFVRLSQRDPGYFEFDDGSFYYPLGHNIAAVHDARAEALQVNIPASEGTYAYDRILSRMAGAGENFGRIWMSPWSFGLEWTKAYDVHYRGLGRYNLLNAWRLDHVLRAAEENGVFVMLLFTAHGEIGDYESDFWGQDRDRMQGSPYWSRYGGPVDHPKELYTRPEVLEIYKKKVRYIVARWGYSPAVMAWEILNEPDLASFYKDNETYRGVTYGELGAQFVKAVANHIQSLDPSRHLITSGCFRYQLPCAEPTLMLGELDFQTGHVFDGNLEQKLLSDLRYMSRYKKIFLPTEAGLTPFAQEAESTALGIHRTLWASFMTPGAGAAAPWWWVLIDRQDLYRYFQALSAFGQGEDRRGMGYEAGSGSVQDDSGQRSLNVVVLTNGDRAFCWIYHPAAFTSRAIWEADPVASATVTVSGLKVGPRRVEVWDAYRGVVIERLDAESRPVDGASGETQLTFKTPPFARDIACKVLPP